jgi:hypothetical protein
MAESDHQFESWIARIQSIECNECGTGGSIRSTNRIEQRNAGQRSILAKVQHPTSRGYSFGNEASALPQPATSCGVELEVDGPGFANGNGVDEIGNCGANGREGARDFFDERTVERRSGVALVTGILQGGCRFALRMAKPAYAVTPVGIGYGRCPLLVAADAAMRTTRNSGRIMTVLFFEGGAIYAFSARYTSRRA